VDCRPLGDATLTSIAVIALIYPSSPRQLSPGTAWFLAQLSPRRCGSHYAAVSVFYLSTSRLPDYLGSLGARHRPAGLDVYGLSGNLVARNLIHALPAGHMLGKEMIAIMSSKLGHSVENSAAQENSQSADLLSSA